MQTGLTHFPKDGRVGCLRMFYTLEGVPACIRARPQVCPLSVLKILSYFSPKWLLNVYTPPSVRIFVSSHHFKVKCFC